MPQFNQRPAVDLLGFHRVCVVGCSGIDCRVMLKNENNRSNNVRGSGLEGRLGKCLQMPLSQPHEPVGKCLEDESVATLESKRRWCLRVRKFSYFWKTTESSLKAEHKGNPNPERSCRRVRASLYWRVLGNARVTASKCPGSTRVARLPITSRSPPGLSP